VQVSAGTYGQLARQSLRAATVLDSCRRLSYLDDATHTNRRVAAKDFVSINASYLHSSFLGSRWGSPSPSPQTLSRKSASGALEKRLFHRIRTRTFQRVVWLAANRERRLLVQGRISVTIDTHSNKAVRITAVNQATIRMWSANARYTSLTHDISPHSLAVV
jgi:hypothetical protein